MRINADLSKRASVHTANLDWSPSPALGVERKMLDRDGGEVARATSLVRFASNSRFEAHEHGGGEEFLVLEGIFRDQEGDYPAGTYVRNPIGSRHAPSSPTGCVLFVKLRQMTEVEEERRVVDTQEGGWEPSAVSGVEKKTLFESETTGETVSLERWERGARLPTRSYPRGGEYLVLEGAFADEADRFEKGSWLRLPAGSTHRPWSETGCVVWVKTGHL